MKKTRFAKITSMFVAILLIAVMMSACGNSNSSSVDSQTSSDSATSSQSSSDTSDTENDEGEWGDEVSKVVMTYLTAGVVPPDMNEVVAEINKLTIPKIGVEVEYKPISIFEAGSQYTTWIAGREEMDLMMIAFGNIGSFVSQGMIDPLDELIAKNAPHIDELGKQFPIYEAAQFEGSTYGISTVRDMYGSSGSYMIDKAFLEEAGLADKYKDQDKITMDDLSEIFAAVKEINPDVYPCGATGMQSVFGFTENFDPLGDTAASGVLMGSNSTDVVNLFETEEYVDFLKHMREWYLAGYIPRDAATSDMNTVELYQSGLTAGYFVDGVPSMKNVATLMGREFVQLQLTDRYYAATSSAGNVYWTIPVTCSDPDAAMRFLDMMYSDKELVNLIQWGIEDKHYVFKDIDIEWIVQPEGIETSTNGYYVPLGLYGDMRMIYSETDDANKELEQALSDAALANPSKGVGFSYNQEAMTSKIIAVQGVITEYQAALDTGTADFDTTYPEFIAKLKANGIEEIIADKQAQFDAWLAEQ